MGRRQEPGFTLAVAGKFIDSSPLPSPLCVSRQSVPGPFFCPCGLPHPIPMLTGVHCSSLNSLQLFFRKEYAVCGLQPEEDNVPQLCLRGCSKLGWHLGLERYSGPPTLHHKCAAPCVWQIQNYTEIVRAEVLGNLPSSFLVSGWTTVWTLSSLVKKAENCTDCPFQVVLTRVQTLALQFARWVGPVM